MGEKASLRKSEKGRKRRSLDFGGQGRQKLPDFAFPSLLVWAGTARRSVGSSETSSPSGTEEGAEGHP